MSKERLEDLEELFEDISNDMMPPYVGITPDTVVDVKWVIQYAKGQAERVQELDKELDRVKVKYRATKEYAYVSMPKISEKNESLTNQNKRYRDSINLALNHIHTGNFTLATVELNKALLKEVGQ